MEKRRQSLTRRFIPLFCSLLIGILCSFPCQAAKPTTIAYIGFATDRPFWAILSDAIRAEATNKKIHLIDLTPPTADIQMQVRFLQHAINKQVDGIILGANSPTELLPILDEALEKKIPIVAIDTAIDHPAVKSLIATDNARGAAIAGEYIVKKTGGKGTLLILGGSKNHPTGDARRAGVAQIASAAGMKINFQQADWEDDKAYLITSQELNKPNDITAIFACWDPGINAASHVVRKKSRNSKLILVGFDGLKHTLENIEKGNVSATIAQNPQLMGEQSIATLLKILSGHPYAKNILIPTYLVDQYYLRTSRQ